MQTDPESSSLMICQLNVCPNFFVVLFLIPFFLKLIVACRLCVIYVREDNEWFQCIGRDYTAYMDYMDHTVRCPQKGR